MQKNVVKTEKVVLEENLYYNKENLITYRIEYPQFFSPIYQNNLNRINLCLKNKAFNLQRTCYKKLFAIAIDFYEFSVKHNYHIRKFEILLTFKVTFNQDCAISLYFDEFEYLGGAHGLTTRTSYTWDIRDGERILLCDLFNDGINFHGYIINSIDNQIKLQLLYDGNNYIYFDDYNKNVAINFNNNNFYLIKSPIGIVLYFQLYDIAPYSMGICEFFMTYDEYSMEMPSCNN
jgi:hypothetical protein